MCRCWSRSTATTPASTTPVRSRVGGGTQARLLPNGVNFGPSMPGAAYTGHSDHEFVTVEQLRLNLMMQAAMLIELAA